MLKRRIIPLLLLKSGRMVKGKKFENFIDTGNPLTAVKVYSSQEADELMFIDIEQSTESKNTLIETIKAVSKECDMPLAVGGGIKSVEDVKNLLLAGADKVIINTKLFNNQKLIDQVTEIFGAQCIIGGIDYKIDKETNNPIVYINCGKLKTNEVVHDYAKKLEKYGVGEVMLNCIDNDGMMGGYDINLIKNISSSLEIPVIACGGAGNFLHLVDLFKETEAQAAACGSIFHFGDNNPIRARSFLRNYDVPMRNLK